MNGRLSAGCTVPVKQAAGGFSPLQESVPGDLRNAFHPLWIAHAKVLPRNRFILKKMGVSVAMEPTLFLCKNLTGNY